MAKTGFWLRGAKGKLAGTTLYRGRTGTVQREIVTPVNPQTFPMMAQRALFAEVAKFYANGQKALFKFAFEDKRSNQTDFNAYMQENVKHGCYFMRDVVKGSALYPMLGQFLMTRGSLGLCAARIAPIYGQGFNVESKFVTSTAVSSASTVAEVSREIINNNVGYENGDIITIVCISSDATLSEESVTSFMYNGDMPPVWRVKQFFLDTNDTRTMADLGIEVTTAARYNSIDGLYEAIIFQFLDATATSTYDCIAGGCIVHSRETATGLKVSISPLDVTNAASTVIGKCYASTASRQYLNEVCLSWGAKGDPILKGSLATRAEAVDTRVPVIDFIQVGTDLQSTMAATPFAMGDTSDDTNPGVDTVILITGSNLPALNREDVGVVPNGTLVSVTGSGKEIQLVINVSGNGPRNIMINKLGGKVCTVSFQ